ncbi:MAG TPA: hypothetical protein V6C76_06755 [Drouetiella sp.]
MSDEKQAEKIDYLHPDDNKPQRPPKNLEEKENEKEAKELTEVAEELRPDKE